MPWQGLAKGCKKAFWWLFFLGSIFCGLFVRNLYFPDDFFDERDHVLLASHLRCLEREGCAEVADRWKNKTTGQTFSRLEVDGRWSVVLFAYGLIGCFAFGYFRRHKADDAFFKYFGMAVCANLALALAAALM